MISFLLRRRAQALLIVGAVSAVLGWSALTLRIDPGVESMIPSGPGDLARLQAFQARFGSDEIIVLAFHSDRLFSRESLERLAGLRDSQRPAARRAPLLYDVSSLVRDQLGSVAGAGVVFPRSEIDVAADGERTC